MTTALPLRTLLAGALLLALSGCDDAASSQAVAATGDNASTGSPAPAPEPAVAAIPQRPSPLLCETRQPMDVLEQCEPGQTLVFLPSRFGNEQFPLIAVAMGCDLTQQVVITNGGVVCTVKVPIAAPAPAEPPPASPVDRDAGAVG